MATVKVQLLLRPEHRNATGIARAVAAATQVGLKVTATGRATLSAEMDAQQFASVFGDQPRLVPERNASDADFGSPSGFMLPEPGIAVPAPLTDVIESIDVAAPYTRLD